MSAEKTKNPFGLTGDVRNLIRDVESKINVARHLIHNTRVALAATEDVVIGDGPNDVSRTRLANNLKDALDLLDEVSL